MQTARDDVSSVDLFGSGGQLGAPVLYRVADVTALLSISRTVVFDLLRTGRLRSVKEGRTRLIPAAAVREYLALLEREVA